MSDQLDILPESFLEDSWVDVDSPDPDTTTEFCNDDLDEGWEVISSQEAMEAHRAIESSRISTPKETRLIYRLLSKQSRKLTPKRRVQYRRLSSQVQKFNIIELATCIEKSMPRLIGVTLRSARAVLRVFQVALVMARMSLKVVMTIVKALATLVDMSLETVERLS